MTGHPFGGVGLRPRPGTICGLPARGALRHFDDEFQTLVYQALVN